MSDTFKIAGFEIAKSDGLLYLDWFLLASMVFIVYAAWKGGQRREKRERSRSVSERPEVPVPKKVETPAKTVREPTPTKATTKSATKSASKATTPKTPTVEVEDTVVTPPATTTPKRRTSTKKKAPEELGQIMSPEGRRSMRLKKSEE